MSELIPGTAEYYAAQLAPEAQKKFGDRELPSTSLEFLDFVYQERSKMLGREEPVQLPEGIGEFVQERLARCGFHNFKADVGSILELWDIFDDYEFQVMMGRIP